jgi:hypothetical protein
MKLIETKTLGTSAASIEFTSIPQTFTDLVVLLSTRTNAANASEGSAIEFKPNGVSTSLGSMVLRGNGSASSSFSDSAVFIRANPSDFTASTFSNSSIYIPNYTGSSFKRMGLDSINENNATLALAEIRSMLRSNTAAITSMTFSALLTNQLVAGSTISLYGILKGSSGGVVVS